MRSRYFFFQADSLALGNGLGRQPLQAHIDFVSKAPSHPIGDAATHGGFVAT